MGEARRSEATILIRFRKYRPWFAGVRVLLEDLGEKVELIEAKVESLGAEGEVFQ
ncbi:hypothetical protein ACH0B6_03315 [Solibacillus silvestris]